MMIDARCRDVRFGPKADILSVCNGVDRHVETEMKQFGSGLVAGISVPNTSIIADALDYAQRPSEPYPCCDVDEHTKLVKCHPVHGYDLE